MTYKFMGDYEGEYDEFFNNFEDYESGHKSGRYYAVESAIRNAFENCLKYENDVIRAKAYSTQWKLYRLDEKMPDLFARGLSQAHVELYELAYNSFVDVVIKKQNEYRKAYAKTAIKYVLSIDYGIGKRPHQLPTFSIEDERDKFHEEYLNFIYYLEKLDETY